jgi:hypothetical protein
MRTIGMPSIGTNIVVPPREVTLVKPPSGSWNGLLGVTMTRAGSVIGAAGLSVTRVTEAETHATTIPRSKSRAKTGLTTLRVLHCGVSISAEARHLDRLQSLDEERLHGMADGSALVI